MAEWLKGHARNYWPYKPDEFEHASMKFDNPKKRFKIAFSQPGGFRTIRGRCSSTLDGRYGSGWSPSSVAER